MKIDYNFKTLKLIHPFKTARKSARPETESLFINLEHEGKVGTGEVRPQEYYYNENFDVSKQVIAKAIDIIGSNPFIIEDITTELKKEFYYAPATVAGLDIALHDLCAKLLDIPLYTYLGVNPENIPVSSMTVGLDDIPVMIEKLNELKGFPIIKIKAGIENDIEMIRIIRENTDAKIRIDANTGWSVEQAINIINEIEKYNIEFIEQPIKPGNYEGLKRIKEKTAIPLYTDEDSVDSRDIPKLVGCADGINIKLMKCGGIREAFKMVKAAKTFGLKVMVGIMLESSVGASAAAHIATMADCCDIDSNLLISNDPFIGMSNKFGKIAFSGKPGLGLTEKEIN